jgi:phenylpyruvate tautomerase PptA (4-oxalocrotonate tautomerase family)
MPYVRISLLRGRSPAALAALSDGVQRALVDAFDTPEGDCFQAIHQHAPGELVFDRDYLGGPRSDDFVLIHVVAGRSRPEAVKRAFYRRLAEKLAASPGIRPEDLMIVLSTTEAADWSFGHGRATMLEGERP